MRVQHHNTNKYILLVSCVSLALSPQVIVYLPRTYSCRIRNQDTLSYGVWGQAFVDIGHIVSPFPEHNLILEAWYGVSQALLQLLLRDSYLIESRRPLWFRFSQANHSAVHLALSIGGRVMQHFNAQSPCASLSSPFSSPCCIDLRYFKMSLFFFYMNQRQCGNIASCTTRAECIYEICT